MNHLKRLLIAAGITTAVALSATPALATTAPYTGTLSVDCVEGYDRITVDDAWSYDDPTFYIDTDLDESEYVGRTDGPHDSFIVAPGATEYYLYYFAYDEGRPQIVVDQIGAPDCGDVPTDTTWPPPITLTCQGILVENTLDMSLWVTTYPAEGTALATVILAGGESQLFYSEDLGGLVVAAEGYDNYTFIEGGIDWPDCVEPSPESGELGETEDATPTPTPDITATALAAEIPEDEDTTSGTLATSATKPASTTTVQTDDATAASGALSPVLAGLGWGGLAIAAIVLIARRRLREQ
ncbi:hypothetical protein [Demequina salsinemoris]|uniref:hypothetical protein n=1 Tax=Demequina salsinemoris TaxID=577470 RepID=UPI0007859700|nr:hypothetical protein [Demequina salsinemoris]